MSQRTLRLPIRAITRSKHNDSQYMCRRCLATQQLSPSDPINTPPPPPTLSSNLPQHKDPSTASNYDASLPSSARDYRLTKSDFYLKKPLPQKLPIQYLQHSSSRILHQNEQAQREKVSGHKNIVGVVVSAGKMDKTVRVRVPKLEWNKRVKKYFQRPLHHLVHDPNSSLIPGDVVSLHRLRVSTQVHHVVAAIITPFEKPIEQRPPVPTADERLSAYKEKKFAKLQRRSLRRQAAMGEGNPIGELKGMGLDPGKGVEAGKGEKANLEKGGGKKRTPSKGAMLGEKGQKQPHGVLPGGKHEVGKINERAQKNKARAMKFKEQTEMNIDEAFGKDEGLKNDGLATDTLIPGQEPVLDPAEGGEGWKSPSGNKSAGR